MGFLSLGQWVVNLQACAVNELDRNVGEFHSDAGCKFKTSPLLHFWKENTPFRNTKSKEELLRNA